MHHDVKEPKEPVARLAAKVAHELNNPLDAVLRFVSLAQRKAQAHEYADMERHLADAQFGLQRMAEFLRELMEIGREAHETAISVAVIPLGQLVAQAARAIAAQAEQKHVVLDIDNALPADCAPRYDLRVSQVVANLLKNAIEASPDGAPVRVRTAPGPRGWIVVTVHDVGPGIKPELMPRLFSPFVTTKALGSGHGLGLAISRELVAALGGTLELENAPLGGCMARVMLPAN